MNDLDCEKQSRVQPPTASMTVVYIKFIEFLFTLLLPFRVLVCSDKGRKLKKKGMKIGNCPVYL